MAGLSSLVKFARFGGAVPVGFEPRDGSAPGPRVGSECEKIVILPPTGANSFCAMSRAGPRQEPEPGNDG